MFPRDTLKGFKLSSAIGPRPRPEPRITISGVVIESRPNPWVPVHDGSIKDEKDLASWELTIPRYECGCRAFYAQHKADNPPDFSTPEAFFRWGVALHNSVNRKLGKPELTIEEALSIWRKNDGLDLQETESERP